MDFHLTIISFSSWLSYLHYCSYLQVRSVEPAWWCSRPIMTHQRQLALKVEVCFEVVCLWCLRNYRPSCWLMLFHVFSSFFHLVSMESGQIIIATSHDLTPKGSWEREIPLFQGNLGWWNIVICPDGMTGSQVLFTSVISDWDCSVGTGFAHGSFGRSLDYFGWEGSLEAWRLMVVSWFLMSIDGWWESELMLVIAVLMAMIMVELVMPMWWTSW